MAGPLEKTFIGLQPCTDPQQKLAFTSRYSYIHKLERKRNIKKCTLHDFQDVPLVDARYKKLGNYQISEFDL